METGFLYRVDERQTLEVNEIIWSCDGVVGIATRYGLKGPEFDSRQGEKVCSSSKRPHSRWDPPNLLLNGYRGSFPVVKRADLETDQLFPSRPKFEWNYEPLCTCPGPFRACKWTVFPLLPYRGSLQRVNGSSESLPHTSV
jgi:hypothetical protein